MKYTVYLRTNKINGKQYVGQTENFKNREKDWKCLKARYANQYIQIDREKYGIDNFDVKKLAEVSTKEEAWHLEQKYIKELDTIYPNGYNRAYGGEKNKGGNVGYHNGREFKKGNEPWNSGRPMSDDEKRHLSEMLVNGKSSKVVLQIKPNGEILEWASNKECKRNGYTNVYLYCNGKNNHYFKGSRWYYKSEYEQKLLEELEAS